MKLKKGDSVLIIAGKDKGRTAKILKSLPKELKVLVDGINLKKKHVRPKKEGEKGQVVAIPAPMDVSNVKLVCPKCGKGKLFHLKPGTLLCISGQPWLQATIYESERFVDTSSRLNCLVKLCRNRERMYTPKLS